jgi:hypothetical protein
MPLIGSMAKTALVKARRRPLSSGCPVGRQDGVDDPSGINVP